MTTGANHRKARLSRPPSHPSNNREPAILATLVPGSYTAIVRGKNDTTGIGLVEAYNLQ